MSEIDKKSLVTFGILNADYHYHNRLLKAHADLMSEMKRLKEFYESIATKDDLDWEQFVTLSLSGKYKT